MDNPMTSLENLTVGVIHAAKRAANLSVGGAMLIGPTLWLDARMESRRQQMESRLGDRCRPDLATNQLG